MAGQADARSAQEASTATGSGKENRVDAANGVAAAAPSALQEQGNAEFKAGNFLKAAAVYTKAIKESPDDPVLYSNRCAALLKLSKVTKALADAEECIARRPEWDKGYYRKGAVLEAMGRTEEALRAYQDSLRLSGENRDIQVKIRNLARLQRAAAAAAAKPAVPAAATAAA